MVRRGNTHPVPQAGASSTDGCFQSTTASAQLLIRMQSAANRMESSLFRFAYFCTFSAVVSTEHTACHALPCAPMHTLCPPQQGDAFTGLSQGAEELCEKQLGENTNLQSVKAPGMRCPGQRLLLALALSG